MARDQRAYSASRRSFCYVVGVLLAPGTALAQASKAIRRIGVTSANGNPPSSGRTVLELEITP